MLKYTVNANNTGVSYAPIIFSGCSLSEDNINIVSNCNVKHNDMLQFNRDIGNDEAFAENTIVNSILEGGFSIKKFKDIRGYVENFVEFKTKKTPYSTISNFGMFVFKNNHCFVKNINITPKENIKGDYSQYDKNLRRCDNDYITYEEIFLYEATVDNKKYVFSESSIRNICNVVLKISGACIEEYFQDKGSYGTNWRHENHVLYLDNCIVPMDNDCRDNRKCILWEGDEDIIHFIERNWNNINVLYNDERFFTLTNELFS